MRRGCACVVRFDSDPAGTNLCSYLFGLGTAVVGSFDLYRSTLLCSNFEKFVRQEINEIVHYLSFRKNLACLSNCHYCADRAQNLPGPAPNDVLIVLQILFKLVHFRLSYSQTCEHRQIGQ